MVNDAHPCHSWYYYYFYFFWGVKPYNIIRVYVYTSEGFIPITRTRHLYVLRLVHKRYTRNGGLKHNVHPVDILHINLFFCPYSKQFVPTGGCISYDDAPSINRILRGRGLYWALGS